MHPTPRLLALGLACALTGLVPAPAAAIEIDLVADINTLPLTEDNPYSRYAADHFPFRQWLLTGSSRIYATDGTLAGTGPFAFTDGTLPGPFDFLFGDDQKVFFLAGSSLGRVDGTGEGDVLLETPRLIRGRSRYETQLMVPYYQAYDPASDRLYFVAEDEVVGRELWVASGDLAHVEPVADIEPGPGSSDPSSLTLVGSRLFFEVRSRSELWVTDGTTAGTHAVTELTMYYNSDDYSEDMDPPSLAALPDGVAFLHEGQLVFSDGTAAGTRRLTAPPSRITLHKHIDPRVTEVAGLLFSIDAPDSGGDEIWRTDGTPEGTYRIASGYLSDLPERQPVTDGHLVYFEGTDVEHGGELWVTDGTVEGTHLLADICPGPCSSGVRVPSWVRGSPPPVPLVFRADDGVHGNELWRTDGTTDGTRLLADLCAGPCSSTPSSGAVLSGLFIVSAHDEVFGQQLWAVDRSGGTALLTAPPMRSWRLLGVTDELLFFTGGYWRDYDSLARTDGTPGGTGLLEIPTDSYFGEEERPGGSFPNDLTVVDDRVFFFASAWGGTQTLWESDGTSEGTRQRLGLHRIESIDRGFGLYQLGDQAFFSIHHELCAIDAGGMRCLTDPSGSITDGTGAEVYQDRLHFFQDGDLRRTDGTVEGTEVVLRAVGPKPGYRTDLEDTFEVAGNRLYFRGGSGLVSTDGTPTGTYAEPFDDVTSLTSFGDRLAFAGRRDGASEIRITGPGARHSEALRETASPGNLAVAGEQLFFVGHSNHHGVREDLELWVSDGARHTTRRAADIAPGPASSTPEHLVAFGDRVVFTADDGVHGREPWISDGTEEGTFLLADIAPGAASSSPTGLTVIGERLLLVADDLVHGREPWISDGTPERTRLLADLFPGPTPSGVQDLVLMGERVYLGGDDGQVGHELRAFDLAVARDGTEGPCVPAPGHLCLDADRFRARTWWRSRRHNTGGPARATEVTEVMGAFSFFDPVVPEILVKVLDASAVTGTAWIFHTPLTDVEYWLEVSDVPTGRSHTEHHRAGTLCGGADLRSLPAPLRFAPLRRERFSAGPPAAVRGESTPLALQSDRFEVTLTWRNPRTPGEGPHRGWARPFTDAAGFYWFFTPDNLEVAIKILDARAVNDRFWVFHAGLTHLEYRLEVTDTVTGRSRTYRRPAGSLCGGADVTSLVDDGG